MNFKNEVKTDSPKSKIEIARRMDFVTTQSDLDNEYARIKKNHLGYQKNRGLKDFKDTEVRKSDSYSFFNHTDVDISLKEVGEGITKAEGELKAVCKENKIEYSKELKCKLLDYYKLLIEWNEKINLTALTKSEDVYFKHFIDSANVIKYIKTFCTVLDVGSGAGFPGLIIALFRPDLKVVLVDSLQKRVDFLNIVIQKLGLTNVTAIHHRVEDKEFKDEYLNQFNYVVSRAVASLDTLSEYCVPFVKVNGEFIAFKADNIEDELKHSFIAMQVMGGKYDRTEEYEVNGVKRKLVFVKKLKKTSDKYPRGLNKPKSNPVK